MPEQEDPQAFVGAVLNKKWRIARAIGQGGLALVFEARDVRTDEESAIKLLRREFVEEPQVVDRFLAEGAAGERAQHPGIAKVFETARAEDGTPYLVMELLRGASLATRMNQGAMPVAEAVLVLDGLLEALCAAHRAGVIHRDLKPENVFVSSGAGNRPVTKLLDFGLARVMDDAGGLGRKTKTGMVLGTPGYMSPEQLHDAKQADARSDLWGAGIILYEMLTGQRAFPAENEMARVTAVLTSDPTPIAERAPHGAHFAPFFARALARDPTARFQSAEEMLEALRATARGDTMQAPLVAAQSAAPAMTGMASFGNAATIVSSPPIGDVDELPPNVQIVVPARRGISIAVVAIIAVVTLLIGVVVGVVVVAAG